MKLEIEAKSTNNNPIPQLTAEEMLSNSGVYATVSEGQNKFKPRYIIVSEGTVIVVRVGGGVEIISDDDFDYPEDLRYRLLTPGEQVTLEFSNIEGQE
jgi:hypothetical protein